MVLLNVHMAEHHKDDLHNGEDAQNDDENAGRDPYPDTRKPPPSVGTL